MAYDPSFTANSSVVAFNPTGSESDIALDQYGHAQHQQWDPSGRAVGYASDPRLHAPQPQRPTPASPADYRPVPVRRATDESNGWESGSSASLDSQPGAQADARFGRTGSPPRTANVYAPPQAPPPASAPTSAPVYSPPQGPPPGSSPTVYAPPQFQPSAPFAQYHPQGVSTPLVARDYADPYQTPTQAQFAAFPPLPASPHQMSPQPQPLPTPTYQSQFPAQSPGYHGREETDATFYTAGDHSRAATHDSVSLPYMSPTAR
jgi:hypothetical protein